MDQSNRGHLLRVLFLLSDKCCGSWWLGSVSHHVSTSSHIHPHPPGDKWCSTPLQIIHCFPPLFPRACMCWHALHQLQHRWPLHGYNKIVSNENKLLLLARTVVATFEKLHVLLKEYILRKYTFLFSHWALDNKLTRPITLTSVG